MNQSQHAVGICRHAAGTICFAVMLTCIGGCTFGPCDSTPIVLLPVYAPLALVLLEPEDHSPTGCNANFVLAGQIIDDRGHPVDSVEAQIVAWVATHGDSGPVGRWEEGSREAAAGCA